jgi:hypothetical protein
MSLHYIQMPDESTHNRRNYHKIVALQVNLRQGYALAA